MSGYVVGACILRFTINARIRSAISELAPYGSIARVGRRAWLGYMTVRQTFAPAANDR